MPKFHLKMLSLIEGIGVNHPISGAIPVLGPVQVSADREVLREFLQLYGLEAMGAVRHQEICTYLNAEPYPLFLLINSESQGSEFAPYYNGAIQLLITGIMLFSTGLWSVRDHFFESNDFFTHVQGLDQPSPMVQSKPVGISCYSATGGKMYSEFTVDEVIRAIAFCNAVLNFAGYDKLESHYFLQKSYLEYDRIDKMWHFVLSARLQYLPPYRLVHYATCLECLLCRENHRIAHTIAERLALLNGQSFESRHSIYDSSKHAYDMRSRFVHGESLRSQPLVEFTDACTHFDGQLRSAVRIDSKGNFVNRFLFDESLGDSDFYQVFTQRYSTYPQIES